MEDIRSALALALQKKAWAVQALDLFQARGTVKDLDGVEFLFAGITDKVQARRNLKWMLFFRRCATHEMVERLCSGDNYSPDLLAFKQSFDLDFTTAILRGRGMLDSVDLGQLKALPVWRKDWMAMMFFTGRAFYLHWFVEDERFQILFQLFWTRF